MINDFGQKLLAIMAISAFLVLFSCEKENMPPSCDIISPSSTDKIAYNEPFTISVNATDSEGPVAKVVLFINNLEIDTKKAQPFSFSINAGQVPIGNVMVKAIAYDGNGATSECSLGFEIVALSPKVRIVKVLGVGTASISVESETLDNGGLEINSMGICFNQTGAPTIEDTKTNDGSEIAVYTSLIENLNHGSTYYLKAYVTTAIGTAYSNEKVISTLDVPQIETKDVTDITDLTAISGGIISSDGNTDLTAAGLCYSTSTNPTTSDIIFPNTNLDFDFVSNLTGLMPNTTYYTRAFATNAIGTTYGSEKEFITLDVPQIETKDVTDITDITAVSGGIISSDGNTGLTAAGLCYSTSTNPTTSDIIVSNANFDFDFVSNMTGLTPNTTYYTRAFATNAIGTTYGSEKEFITPPSLPDVITNLVSAVGANSVTMSGEVIDDGGESLIENGFYWGTTSEPETDGTKLIGSNSIGVFDGSLTGLNSYTTYYYIAYASNSAGTGFGVVESFKTGSILDSRDGNIYETVIIGSQTWMAENLSYLPNVSPPSSGSQTTAYYYVYDYNGTNVTTAKSSSNYQTYGVLYNWAAAMNGESASEDYPSGVKGACPTDWHLPSPLEVEELLEYIGGVRYGLGYENAGGPLKETGTTRWISPNVGATNAYGFNGLPAGRTNTFDKVFDLKGRYGKWWTTISTGSSCNYCQSWTFGAYYNDEHADYGVAPKANGFSIRCVKD